ncbi:MAG TPA: GAF domain-containing protein, partial [Tianweitania sediminis]|nr:GAF domain-containing protein [Tianweitania sediminis]
MIVSEPHGDPLPVDVRDVLNRDERNAVLTSLNLESGPDSDFQNVVSLASDLLGTKVALVTLLDREQQTFHAKTGTTLTGSPADVSFCAHAIAQPGDDAFVVENAAKDPRFEHNPLVTGEPKIRFYAGVPMTVMGEKIGTLCVIDTIPRPRPTDVQLKQLQQLAGLAATLFKLKDSANRGDKARAALVREEKRHTLALEAANIASWVWDLRTGMIECDELMPRFFGLPHANRIPSLRIFRAIDRRDTHQALRNI